MALIYDAQGLHTDRPNAMRTFQGKKVDPFEMELGEIVWSDIVHSLSRQCRFNGHTKGHLSVARHSMWVQEWVMRHLPEGMTINEQINFSLAALLHDAAEAYIGDMIRPLKKREQFAVFGELDDRVTALIYTKAQLPFTELPALVHEADNAVGTAEVNVLRYQYEGDFRTDEEEYGKRLFAYLADERRHR